MILFILILKFPFKPTQERDLLNTFQIPTTTFVRFMLSVEDSYRENPYHNSFHAADVTQVLPKKALKQSRV